MNKSCCGFGHRDVLFNITEELSQIVEKLITENGVEVFYVGEQGDFDRIFTTCVRKNKEKHKNIQLILVVPYLTKQLVLNKEYYSSGYDDVIIYSSDKRVHPRSAFYERNKYMVDISDFVIAYLYREHGGAYSAVSYAKRRKKRIVYIKKTRQSVTEKSDIQKAVDKMQAK